MLSKATIRSTIALPVSTAPVSVVPVATIAQVSTLPVSTIAPVSTVGVVAFQQPANNKEPAHRVTNVNFAFIEFTKKRIKDATL